LLLLPKSKIHNKISMWKRKKKLEQTTCLLS
jgi:hypothetical protein